MKILTSEIMQQVDRTAIEVLGVPGPVLMENAALGVVEALTVRWPESRRVVIFCGPGNNGGDGYAVGRHLAVRGYRVGLWSVGKRPGGDAELQLGICERMGLSIAGINGEEDLGLALAAARDADVVVDALFGTGLKRPLEGLYAAVVEGLDALPVPLLAVDLPSGLDASRHDPIGPHPRVELTVTFAAPKVAQVFYPAAASVGEVVVTDLGVPDELVEGSESQLYLLGPDDLRPWIPERPREAHKGSYGHLLLVAGGPGKTGAALLAARAAVRGGTGLVTVGVPSPWVASVDVASLESMTLGLAADAGGRLAEEAAEVVLREAASRSALAIGPGLGTEPSTRAAIRRVVTESTLPLVLDADGLNAFAGGGEELRQRAGATVLTPHPGELARLLGCTAGEIQADRRDAASRAAEKTGAVVVLKGFQTLVAEPEGGLWVNPTGNPGMATGGSGDVLTGLLGGFLAQGLAALPASLLAVYLHGLAGDLAAAEIGEPPLAAGDLLDRLPAAFRLLATGD